MRSVLALSLAGSAVAMPFGGVFNAVFGRNAESQPDFRPARGHHHHHHHHHPTGTGTGAFPFPTGGFPTASGGMSVLPFPFPTGAKTLSKDYGLAPTVTGVPEFTLPTEAPGQEEAISGEQIDVEKEDEPSFVLPTGVPTEDPAPRPTAPFPTFVPTGVFPTGGFPTGGFPTGVFPTGGFPTGGFPSTLMTFTRGPAPTGQPPLPENPTEEEWQEWWQEWLQWAKQFSGLGKSE